VLLSAKPSPCFAGCYASALTRKSSRMSNQCAAIAEPALVVVT